MGVVINCPLKHRLGPILKGDTARNFVCTINNRVLSAQIAPCVRKHQARVDAESEFVRLVRGSAMHRFDIENVNIARVQLLRHLKQRLAQGPVRSWHLILTTRTAKPGQFMRSAYEP